MQKAVDHQVVLSSQLSSQLSSRRQGRFFKGLQWTLHEAQAAEARFTFSALKTVRKCSTTTVVDNLIYDVDFLCREVHTQL